MASPAAAAERVRRMFARLVSRSQAITFPPGDTKIGWCVFESKPGSKWTAELLKKKQDTEKKDWATQDVYEIMKPAGIDAHYC